MSNRILVLYGSYRSDRKGIRLANYAVSQLRSRGDDVELIDAKVVGLPMLDRIAKNETYMHQSRARAAEMAEAIRNMNNPKK